MKAKIPKKLLRITAPHFVAAIEIGGRAAPIIYWMRRLGELGIRDYCKRKGWKVDEV